MSKKRNSSWVSELSREIKQYFQETTFHGFRYLVDSRNNFERLLWCVAISVSVAIAGYSVIDSLTTNYQNPIITTLDTTVVQNVWQYTGSNAYTLLAVMQVYIDSRYLPDCNAWCHGTTH